jgi:exodeoxyribonuclease VII large subunit
VAWDLFSSAESARAARGGGDAVPTAIPVGELNRIARELLEGAFPAVWVSGEVTGWKRHKPTGHCYFCLRDAAAQVRCVLFRADAQRLPTEPEEGMQVRALGSLTLYERRGDYQLVVRSIEGVGAGGLWRLALERLKAKLEAEGLLAPERKRPIPRFPETVGIVTSPVGAALHDILHVIGRRAPWTRVVFAPARVQGEGAAEDIARAIRRIDREGAADVLIVGRGGGSVEDLWAFNQEVVARAIATCETPVISAVGHEVDVTIADLVADERAPTPSAAAERAVPDGEFLRRHLAQLGTRLGAGLRLVARERRRDVQGWGEALEEALQALVRQRRNRLARGAAKLEALSPLAALGRGYAVAQAPDGRLLRRAADFRPGDTFLLRVAEGRVRARTEDVEETDG